jgi:hypothetical protein
LTELIGLTELTDLDRMLVFYEGLIIHRKDSEISFFFSFASERPRWHGMQAKANEKQSLSALFALR